MTFSLFWDIVQYFLLLPSGESPGRKTNYLENINNFILNQNAFLDLKMSLVRAYQYL